MYVCTLEEFISSRCSHIAVQVGTEIINDIEFTQVFIQTSE